MFYTLTVQIELDWGKEDELRAFVEPLTDWITEQGRIDEKRFKWSVSTHLSPEDAT